MSSSNLNKFIGKTLISDSTREAAMGGQLAELLHQYDLDAGEIEDVLAAQPESIQDLYVLAAQLEARYATGVTADVIADWPGLEMGVPIDDYPMY